MLYGGLSPDTGDHMDGNINVILNDGSACSAFGGLPALYPGRAHASLAVVMGKTVFVMGGVKLFETAATGKGSRQVFTLATLH